ncbi:IMP dehydrogenase, partial [Acinetobacter baumannii]|uniref:IMP dehydrogenase n=1 Tax=Acinetobacter baumannii TaxID=470 RepID=UPI0013D3DFBC
GAYRVASEKVIRARMDKVFETFPRLGERARQLAGTMSGGEQAMVSIGRGLMTEPKLLVVDEHYRCVGLITVKDMEKQVANPNACKDEQGRLRVAAATTIGDAGFARTEMLVDAGVDLVQHLLRMA